MRDMFYCCLTLIICVYMLCATILKTNEYQELDAGEIEALKYIAEKADYMGITTGEYIQLVKEYEEEQNAMYEYFEKVENGTNTKADDRRAEINGWVTE